jgi:hypothetical protein
LSFINVITCCSGRTLCMFRSISDPSPTVPLG